MNIHEFQAKSIFANYDIPCPKGFLASNATEAEFAYRRLKSDRCVVKAQIHAGGRGKGGGVKLVNNPQECFDEAQKMLGMNLVTHQTGPEGKIVSKIYVEAASSIAKEYYLALLIDRETANIILMFSTEGGMDIEQVAADTPEKIINIHIDPTIGLQAHHLRKLVFNAHMNKDESKHLTKMVTKLYSLFTEKDLSLVEINPLITTTDHKVLALDGKLQFDDNALYKHPDIESMRDFTEEDSREVEASKHHLNYIGLDGNIGCLVNGAGLAMATMDIIKHFGGEPANFLDVGGGASEDMVKNAFRIILQDQKVKAIFVNIFGGIMRCDIIAKGIISASKDLGIHIPVITRLEGTNVKEGKELLEHSGLKIITAENMADGAQKAVKALS